MRTYTSISHIYSFYTLFFYFYSSPPHHPPSHLFFFFFNDTATTEIYTLSLHDALPIQCRWNTFTSPGSRSESAYCGTRSEEHTSELQSRVDLVCRLLLEKKKQHTLHEEAAKQNEPQNASQHIYTVS